MAAVAPAAGDDLSTIPDDDSSQQDEPRPNLTRNPSGLSDSELDARLAFLEKRLDDGETYAKVWQWSWTGAYGLGVVIGTVQAATCCSNEKGGRHGADSMRAIEGDSREAKLARLAEGESVLQSVAKTAERRWHWKPHVGNIALNTAGAAFIFGFGRNSDAWESLGIGIGVGTLNILTAPKRGIKDLNDYETRFGMKTASRFNWTIVPTMGGAALRVTF
jgi:hypothetical protein